MFCLNVLGKSVSVCMSVCLGPGAEWPLEELGEGAGGWAGVSVYTGAQLQPAVQPANYMVRLIQREKSSHFFTF